MEKPLLNDPDIKPDADVLKKTLARAYAAYETLAAAAGAAGLEMTWNYYKDGKAWLCKVVYKKKTVFWLSAWDGYIKTGFYFTEKTRAGVAGLDVDENIKTAFARAGAAGKLVPLSINVSRKAQVRDVMALAEYKKALK